MTRDLKKLRKELDEHIYEIDAVLKNNIIKITLNGEHGFENDNCFSMECMALIIEIAQAHNARVLFDSYINKNGDSCPRILVY
jgi:hypothetical protein